MQPASTMTSDLALKARFHAPCQYLAEVIEWRWVPTLSAHAWVQCRSDE